MCVCVCVCYVCRVGICMLSRDLSLEWDVEKCDPQPLILSSSEESSIFYEKQ